MSNSDQEINAITFDKACYNTTCLTSIDAIIKVMQSSIMCCDNFTLILKARIAAEEKYARSMAKSSCMELNYEGGGQLQEAFDQMKV